MIRPSPHFLRRAPTLERALLTRHMGHPVGMLVAANDAPLAHCAECNLFLLPHESCLHMPAVVAPFHPTENGDTAPARPASSSPSPHIGTSDGGGVNA